MTRIRTRPSLRKYTRDALHLPFMRVNTRLLERVHLIWRSIFNMATIEKLNPNNADDIFLSLLNVTREFLLAEYPSIDLKAAETETEKKTSCDKLEFFFRRVRYSTSSSLRPLFFAPAVDDEEDIEERPGILEATWALTRCWAKSKFCSSN